MKGVRAQGNESECESALTSCVLPVVYWTCHLTLKLLSEALFSVEVTAFCHAISRL